MGMSPVETANDPGESTTDSDLGNKWKKNTQGENDRHKFVRDKKNTLTGKTNFAVIVNGPSSLKGLAVPAAHNGMDRNHLQQQRQHSSNQQSNSNSNSNEASSTPGNPNSLLSLNFANNNGASMNYPHAQPNQGQNGFSSTGNNAAWLQHMILNPIHPLQNATTTSNNGGNGTLNNPAHLQQLQGNLNSLNTDTSGLNSFQQQASASPGDSENTLGAHSLATSQAKLLQDQQKFTQSLSGRSSQSQLPQAGLQLNQLLSSQQPPPQSQPSIQAQNQLLPMNELASQLQLPSAMSAMPQQGLSTGSSNQMTALSSALTSSSSSSTVQQQQQQQQLLLLSLMLQQNNANSSGLNLDASALSTLLASPDGMRLLNTVLSQQPPVAAPPPSLQDNLQAQPSQQATNLASLNAGAGPAASLASSGGIGSLSGLGDDQFSFLSSPQGQSASSTMHHGLPPPPSMPLLNSLVSSSLDPNEPRKLREKPSANPSYVSSTNSSSLAASSDTAPSSASSSSLDVALLGSSSAARRAVTSKSSGDTKIHSKVGSQTPQSAAAAAAADAAKAAAAPKNSLFPRVLYCKSDDAILGEYQTLLRQQLELFEADGHDVINGTFRQGRTTPIRLGQIGLRCRHCAKAPLSIRTKGSVYFSQTIKGMYQIGQNMSKVHLCERCPRLPPDIKKRMITLRSRRHRASGGRAYWIRHLRELGIYEDGTVLRARPVTERKKPPGGKSSTKK